MSETTPSSRSTKIPLGVLPPNAGSICVRFEGTRHALESFEMLFFLNLPQEEIKSLDMLFFLSRPQEERHAAMTESPHFVDSLFMYGLGTPQYAGERAPETAPFDMSIDISPEMVANVGRGHPMELTLIVVAPDGRLLEPSAMQFKTVSVEALPK